MKANACHALPQGHGTIESDASSERPGRRRSMRLQLKPKSGTSLPIGSLHRWRCLAACGPRGGRCARRAERRPSLRPESPTGSACWARPPAVLVRFRAASAADSHIGRSAVECYGLPGGGAQRRISPARGSGDL